MVPELQRMTEHVRIVFNPMDKVVEVERGTILLDAVREAGIMIKSICGGKGECGKCKVILNEGAVSRRSSRYEKFLSSKEISEGYRLSCQVKVLGNCEFTIPVESRVSSPKILLSMEMNLDRLEPATNKVFIKPFSWKDPLTDLKRRLDPRIQLNKEIHNKILEIGFERSMTTTLSRTGDFPEVISVKSGDHTDSNYGLAIDVGTTTLVAFLVDLRNGEIVGRASDLNKQITYGETLITRIAFARESDGLRKLQQEVVESINGVVDSLTSSAGIENEDVTDICVGGNTVMNHLLAGIDVDYLWFVDANDRVPRDPIIKKAKTVGLHVNPEAYIYCLPNVSRFLGGDAIGDVLATGMCDSDDISLMVDMGTNGEIIFGNNNWLVSCSVASGPAFEGAGVRFGMRGMRGGIDHVRIDPESFEAEYTVIGDTRPKGICGSGIIDVSAEMFSAGILDFAGKIVGDHTSLVRKGDDGLEYVITYADKTAIGRDIVITQRDMDYVMDSKAATCGGVMVLMKKFKFSIYDVKNFYLAGAFGAYTNLENATKLGIFPEFPNAKIKPIGNGSISGAYATLLSMKKREQAKAIAENMIYIDLLEDVMFAETYQEAIYIPGKKELFPSYA
jgi:uncharacterized 2Fe-2S/4Fe-4S cluster protein (DUF4445 family)